MRTIFRSYLASIALLAVVCAQPAWAQVDSVTTTPTKVYAAVGGGFSFSSTYTSATGSSSTDLLIEYTANTSNPSLVPYALCIDLATPAPYDGAQPNTKYVNFDAGIAFFPSAAACGSQTTVTLGTFSGTVANFPAGGSYTIVVFNNNASGALNVTTNDVLICQKTTVSSITAPADAFEGTAQTFTVNFAAAVPAGCGGFSIPVALSGTATAAPDNVGTTNNCSSVPDSATSCTVIVQGTDDAAADGNKVATLSVTDSTPSSVYVSSGKSANANVLDNEVSASVSATNASETGPTNGVVTFTRGGPTTSTLNLSSAIGGTATYTTDYTLTVGTCVIVTQNSSSITVTVPIGSSSCTINVVPVDDTVVETGGETVTFAPPTGINVTPAGSTATVLIADNDGLPAVGVSAAGSCAEAVVPVNCTFTVTATTNTSPPQTGNGPLVPFTLTGSATNNTDYKLVNGANCADAAFTGPIQTVFGTPTTLTVCVIDDLTVESGGETVVLTLTANPSLYALSPASASQTIANDDSPQSVSVAASLPAITEIGGSTTFVFTRSGGSGAAQQAALTANVTLGGTATFGTNCAAGVDFTLAVVGPATASLNSAPRTVTFPASVSTAAVTIAACDDSLFDPNETATLTVAPPTVATDYTVATAPANTATVTITDNEIGVGVVATTPTITEGGNAVFTISCQGTAALTVNYSFSGSYVPLPANGSNTLTCGTLLVVSVPTADDTQTNGDRTLILTITSVGEPGVVDPANTSATVIVQDNDVVKTIPTMNTLGLILLGLLLTAAAGFGMRRKA